MSEDRLLYSIIAATWTAVDQHTNGQMYTAWPRSTAISTIF